MKDFYELFISELKEIYATEKAIVKLLPSVIKMTRSTKLRDVISQHLREGESQVMRLEQIFSELNESKANAKCLPIEGMIHEWKHVVKAHYDDDVQDAAIISFLQKIEHYEIASYGTLRTFAKHLNLASLEVLLKESAKEEGAADKKLTDIAEGSLFTSGVNAKACKKRCA